VEINVPPADPLPAPVLIVAPHMDDEVLACGGTIARLSDKSQVFVAYATDGAQPYRPVIPWRDATSPELARVRVSEARAALATLGVHPEQLFFLDLPDGQLRRHHALLSRRLLAIVDEVRPASILIPFRYDRHPDHLAVNRAVMAMLSARLLQAQIFEYFVYYRWRMLPRRDIRAYLDPSALVSVDIGAVAQRKRAALDCFTSQTTHFYPWQDRPILSLASLDEVCRNAELFLRYDPQRPGAAVLTRARAWIRLVHELEPRAKRSKDRVMAIIRRGVSRYGRSAG